MNRPSLEGGLTLLTHAGMRNRDVLALGNALVGVDLAIFSTDRQDDQSADAFCARQHGISKLVGPFTTNSSEHSTNTLAHLLHRHSCYIKIRLVEQ